MHKHWVDFQTVSLSSLSLQLTYSYYTDLRKKSERPENNKKNKGILPQMYESFLEFLQGNLILTRFQRPDVVF